MPTIEDIKPEVLEKLQAQNPHIILKHLLSGREWEHNGSTYVLSDDYELCAVAWQLDEANGVTCDNFKEGERRYLKTDMSLGCFLKMAINAPIDETAVMAANMALLDGGYYGRKRT